MDHPQFLCWLFEPPSLLPLWMDSACVVAALHSVGLHARCCLSDEPPESTVHPPPRSQSCPLSWPVFGSCSPGRESRRGHGAWLGKGSRGALSCLLDTRSPPCLHSTALFSASFTCCLFRTALPESLPHLQTVCIYRKQSFMWAHSVI